MTSRATPLWVHLVASTLFAGSLPLLAQQGPGVPAGLYFETSTLDDNQLLHGVAVGTLDCVEPVIDDVSVDGNTISIGGYFPDCMCACLVPVSFAVPFSVGPFEPGQYDVRLVLETSGGDSLPWGQRPLEVLRGSDTVLLQDGRFAVDVVWTDFAGGMGGGRPVPGPESDDSTLFTFFDRQNWELMVKVIDGCSFNGQWWVFTAAATDVEYTVTVTDTQTGALWASTNLLGVAAPAINDTSAFDCP